MGRIRSANIRAIHFSTRISSERFVWLLFSFKFHFDSFLTRKYWDSLSLGVLDGRASNWNVVGLGNEIIRVIIGIFINIDDRYERKFYWLVVHMLIFVKIVGEKILQTYCRSRGQPTMRFSCAMIAYYIFISC